MNKGVELEDKDPEEKMYSLALYIINIVFNKQVKNYDDKLIISIISDFMFMKDIHLNKNEI